MEAVPFRGFDPANDGVGGVLLGNGAAEGDWEEKTVGSALVIDGVWDLACGLPGFCVNVLGWLLVGAGISRGQLGERRTSATH